MEISTVSTSQSTVDSNYAAFYVNIIIGSLGLIGNAFVCLVMLRYRSIFNSTTNKLIIHQSVVDFLGSFMFFLSLFLVVSPQSQIPENIFGSLYCKLWWSTWPQCSLYTVSTYNLVAISIERYYATCQPVRHRNKFSGHRLKMIVAVIWICGLVPSLLLILTSYKTEDGCGISWPGRTVQVVGLFIFYSILIFIPFIIIVFSYIKIILELLKRSRARVGDNNQDARNMLTRANKNTTLTLFVVAIFFVICWTPVSTNYALYNLGLNNNYNDPTLVDAIAVLNLCINPFIYCFTYERFQRQVKEMVCGGRQHNVNHVDTTSGSTRQKANTQRTVQVSVVASANLPDSPAES